MLNTEDTEGRTKANLLVIKPTVWHDTHTLCCVEASVRHWGAVETWRRSGHGSSIGGEGMDLPERASSCGRAQGLSMHSGGRDEKIAGVLTKV